MTNSEARKRAQTEVDDWCRSESCRYRDWRSGSVPTHRLGADCPAPAAASQVQGAAEVGADVEALAGLLLWHGRDDGIGRNLGQYRTEYTCDCGESYTSGPGGTDYLTHLASSITDAGWVPPERVAEARAEERRRIAQVVREQYDAYLASPGLSSSWTAGWHSATNHIEARIAERGDD